MEEKIYPLSWRNVAIAGLVSAFVLLLATSGNVWGYSALVVPTLMGRELVPRDAVAPVLSVEVVLMHAALAVLYTAIIAVVVQRMRVKMAVLTGALIGMGLYAMNYLMFHFLLTSVHKGAEIQAFFTHLVFGMMAAAAYVGLTRRSPRNAPISV